MISVDQCVTSLLSWLNVGGGYWGLSETEKPAKISIETEKPKKNLLKTENPPRIMIQTLQPLIQQRNIGLFNLYMAY